MLVTKNYNLYILILALAITCSVTGKPANEQQLQLGAKIFQQRCVLCHGDHGMGEGLLPIIVAKYPSTNLFKKKFIKDPSDLSKLRQLIAEGSIIEGISDYMPPWKDELTWNELETVTQFTQFLYFFPDKAYEYISNATKTAPMAKYAGQKLFVTRCSMCHGRYGEGNGRLAKVIRNPPPYNLTKSTASLVYLQQIITKGGAAMNRSKHMPPWGKELTETEINAIIQYLLKLRNN
ncbi:cytochrome c [Spartinivicinus poritis]|uniref:C-type cytochrome n=1 Tax=Spartinivicinus poritis TaxID=2994640 RepID=A0ABT5U5K6_9GAMM|nr:c-type cytochrome [Spartinivicinus sp. A2-2]MDE1461643.1 c-type cytochrome [Spartinivicinus sp. A2-2]